jgi:hypothetical protein
MPHPAIPAVWIGPAGRDPGRFIPEEPGWAAHYPVIDTRNWLPGKNVLVAPAWIRRIDWMRREVTVDLSRDVLQSAPPYDASAAIGREYEGRLAERSL